MKFYISLICLAATVISAQAAPRKSLLNNDPNVIYLNEHIDRKIYLMVAKEASVYNSKTANRKLGVYPVNTKLELIAITDKAYQVKGKAKHAGVTGWVSPKLLASTDKNFIANFKKLYERQMVVKELIASKEVAIGMTLDEVTQSKGKPTETEVKQTRKGQSGKWSYVVQKEQKHYRTIVDSRTGNTYRQFSHITTEEKSRITIEFENNTVTTMTRKQNNGPGKVRIIPAPFTFYW